MSPSLAEMGSSDDDDHYSLTSHQYPSIPMPGDTIPHFPRHALTNPTSPYNTLREQARSAPVHSVWDSMDNNPIETFPEHSCTPHEGSLCGDELTAVQDLSQLDLVNVLDKDFNNPEPDGLGPFNHEDSNECEGFSFVSEGIAEGLGELSGNEHSTQKSCWGDQSLETNEAKKVECLKAPIEAGKGASNGHSSQQQSKPPQQPKQRRRRGRKRIYSDEEERKMFGDLRDLKGVTAAESRKMTPEERFVMLHKRRLRNRESAARSRARKSKTVHDLTLEIEKLRARSELVLQRCQSLEEENLALKEELYCTRQGRRAKNECNGMEIDGTIGTPAT